MASKRISIQEEHVLKLILEFLSSRKYYKTARSLEKETGVTRNAYSENISFLRDLVLDGDWAALREFGEPFADIPSFDYRKFNFLVAKQEYLEILFEKCEGNRIKDEQGLRDRLLVCLQNLERYCTFKEEYNKLYWYLSVPSLHTEPEFCNWSVDSSRMQLFEEMLDLLKQFIPVGEQNLAKDNLALHERLLNLIFKGSLYESCIEFCQKQAMGKMGKSDFFLTDIKVDLFRKQSLKSAGNFYSWFHSLSKECFVEPFEELNFELHIEKQKQRRVNTEVRNNSLSQSLTIELKSPVKALSQKGRDERRTRLSDFPSCKPTVLDFNMRDVSQSFAEFEFANTSGLTDLSNIVQKSASNDQDVFLQNGEMHVPLSKTAESPRKIRRDQQDLVLQQLEEHKQRQRDLYLQLAESASLARAEGKIKDSRVNDVIPDESARSLEAVKKSIQSLKLLAENYESPKHAQAAQPDLKNDVFSPSEDHSHRLNTAKKSVSQSGSSQKDFHHNAVSIASELPAKKSSSSSPGSADVPKTPVNTVLPPGLVKFTDGSGAFGTSTPKAERQSFTTPLPASPVTLEQKIPKYDVVQSHQGNPTQQKQAKQDTSGQTPKAGVKHLTVRRSLVNTVFQNEDESKVENDSEQQARVTLTNNTDALLNTSSRLPKAIVNPLMKTGETKSDFAKENDGSDLMESTNQTTTAFESRNSVKDSRLQTSSGLNSKTGRIHNYPNSSNEPNVKSSRFQNYSASINPRCSAGNRLSSPNESKFHGITTETSTRIHSPRKEEPDPKSAGLQNYSTASDPQRIVGTHNSPRRTQTDAKFRDISAIKSTRSNPQSAMAPITNTAKGLSDNVPVLFQRSAMLADTQAIRAVAFHPSGNYFAVGTNSKALKICRKNESRHIARDEQETTELEVLCQKTSLHKGSVYCVAFNSKGDIIATGSNDKTIKLLKFNEDDPVGLEDHIELSIHNATVRDLTFVHTAAGGHPVLASGGAGGGLIHLSDCYTGQTLSSLQGHAGNVMAVFAGDQAHLLCSGSADKTVRLWDLRMAKYIDVIPTSSCVTSVCFNYGTAHSLLLASADDSGQCIAYDVGARKSITSFTPHEMDCRSIRFSPDSQHILTGSYDACVAITSVHYSSSELLSDSYVVARHRDKVIQCRWHPREYTFLSSSADRTVVLWEEI